MRLLTRHARNRNLALALGWLFGLIGWATGQGWWVWIAALWLNLYAMGLMWRDKRAARHKGAFRVPERSLFALAALGGPFGVASGMVLFRHKTRHLSFQTIVPLCCLAYLALARFLFL